MRPSSFILAFLFFSSLLFSYYHVELVDSNTLLPINLTYDDNSSSYKDHSIENPDVLLKICSYDKDLLGKYIFFGYADGWNGDFLDITHGPTKITYVLPSGCAYVPLEISSFKALYPAIPFIVISDDQDPSTGDRWKLTKNFGWLVGNFSVNYTIAGGNVLANVSYALDDQNNHIPISQKGIVLGIVLDNWTTLSTKVVEYNQTVSLNLNGWSGDWYLLANGIGALGDNLPPYVIIFNPEEGRVYPPGDLPVIFSALDDDQLDRCWIILDNSREIPLPDCDHSYVLSSLSSGKHTVSVYAKDISENVGFDTVDFYIKEGVTYPSGSRVFPRKWVIAYGSASKMMIVPNVIHINYSHDAFKTTFPFKVFGNFPMWNITCTLSGDLLEKYSQVYMNRPWVSEENSSTFGEIVIRILPDDALKLSNFSGILTCKGNFGFPGIFYPISASVFVNILKPSLSLEDSLSFDVLKGDEKEFILPLSNNGTSNISNLSIVSSDSSLIKIEKLPIKIPTNEKANFTIKVFGKTLGNHSLKLEFYEYGIKIAERNAVVFVHEIKAKPKLELYFGLSSFHILFFLFIALLFASLIWMVHRDVKSHHSWLAFLPYLLLFVLVFFLSLWVFFNFVSSS